MPFGTSRRHFTAGLIGLLLGAASVWLNDSSPLWPAQYSDEAQWPFNMLFFTGIAYVYLAKPTPKP